MSGYDLIVVGLGAAGAATLCQAARRGARVLGLDRYAPPHNMGSSHGESRITRQAIGEGLEYVPLALRAQQLWREIESETDTQLMRQTGVLLVSAPSLGAAHQGKADFLELTFEAARVFGIAHEALTAAEVRARWPVLRAADHEQAYFEPGAGVLHPERCIAAQLDLAARHGAAVRLGESVCTISDGPDGAEVLTDQGRYVGARIAVCAGAWSGGLLGGPYGRALTLYRQTMHWFEPDDPGAFAPERFPAFIWMHGAGEGDWFYGFPNDPEHGGVKLASEQFALPTGDPAALDRTATRREALAQHARHVAPRIGGLPPAWLRSRACVYTCAPESRFVIGPDPDRERLLVVSACSGHGFKHSAAIGEAVAELALTGAPPPVLAPFSPARLYASP